MARIDTVSTEVFKFDELSDEAKENAHSEHLNSGFDYGWTDELVDSLKAFADIFPVKITDWSFDSTRADVRWEFTADDDIENLSGFRLATYIYNHYWRDLFKPKFIGSLKTNEYVKHNRIKSPLEVNSVGNRFNPYYSGCQRERSCVLTGVCFDEDILDPIYTFLKKPDQSTNFSDLMGECISGWESAARGEMESQESLEYFKDLAEANEYEFTAEGDRYW